MLDYYPLAALPALRCAYLAYDRFGGLPWRRLGPGVLCAGMFALLPINIHYGFQYRDWYHGFVDPFANEIKAGVPVDELSYHGATGAWKTALLDLRHAGIGVFSRIQDRGAIPPGRRVDDFENGTLGLSTLGGVSSAGVIEGSGRAGCCVGTTTTTTGPYRYSADRFPLRRTGGGHVPSPSP